jgi:hypothetical protein
MRNVVQRLLSTEVADSGKTTVRERRRQRRSEWNREKFLLILQTRCGLLIATNKEATWRWRTRQK